MNATLLFNGQVWGHPGSDAILFAEGVIEGIGEAGRFADVAAEGVDARGGSILPGFIDGHTHLLDTGLTACGWQLDISGCDRAEALGRIAAAGRSRSGGEWLLATGWDESRWNPAARLELADLDRAAPGSAVVAVRVDGHLAVLNSTALRRGREAVEAVPRLLDPSTGEVREAAVERLRSLVHPDAAILCEALRAAVRVCHGLGITTAHVMSGLADPLALLEMAHNLRLRLVVHPPAERLDCLVADGVRTGDGDEWGRWGGVKLFADGSIGARNAAVSSRYECGGRGALNYRFEPLWRQIAAADRHGWQTLTHAIGDRAIGQVLRAHRRAGSDRDLRHRIEHYELPTDAQVRETRDLGLAVCMQPNFVGNWSGAGGLYETALGSERDAACNPFRAVLEAGIPLGFGSDGMPLGPLYGIASAVQAPHAGQRVSPEAAVRGYTAGSALLSGNAPAAGALAVGLPADIVVLDGPVGDDGLARRSVVRTWVDGEPMSRGMEDR